MDDLAKHVFDTANALNKVYANGVKMGRTSSDNGLAYWIEQARALVETYQDVVSWPDHATFFSDYERFARCGWPIIKALARMEMTDVNKHGI